MPAGRSRSISKKPARETSSPPAPVLAGCTRWRRGGQGRRPRLDPLSEGLQRKRLFSTCFNMGSMYEEAAGYVDAGRADEFYRQACDGGFAGACAKVRSERGRGCLPAGRNPSVAGYQPSWDRTSTKVRGTDLAVRTENVKETPLCLPLLRGGPIRRSWRAAATTAAAPRGPRRFDDFQSIVGKTLEFNGEVVNQPCAEKAPASGYISETRHHRRPLDPLKRRSASISAGGFC